MPTDDLNGQYTDAQLSDGTILRFQGQLSPQQVGDKVAAYRLKQPAQPGDPNYANQQARASLASKVQPNSLDTALDTTPQPTPADQISASLGRSIQKQDRRALISGNPKDVAGSPTRMAKTAIDYGRAATSPQGLGTAAGVALANTNPITGIPVDAALIGHGLYTAGTNASDALQGNPDALEHSLMGMSEAAGGGAALRGLKPSVVEDPNVAAQRALLTNPSSKGAEAL